MPAEALARQWADRRTTGWRDAALRLTVHSGGDANAGEAEAPAVEARLWLKRPERARWQPQDRRATTIIDHEGQRSRGQGRVQAGEATVSPALWLAWLLPHARKADDVAPRLMAVLKHFHINSEVVSLGRFAGGLVYIIGAQPWQPEPPQLWLDKDSLVPVRTLIDVASSELAELTPAAPAPAGAAVAATVPLASVAAAATRVRLDTRLGGWGSGPGGARLPAYVETWLGERRLQRWEVRSAKLDGRLGEGLFGWGRPHSGP